MRRRPVPAGVGVACLLSLAAWGCGGPMDPAELRPAPVGGRSVGGGPEVLGVPDPAWTLRTLEGRTFTLEDLRGRPVFVNFWATWCPPCVEELPSIQRLARAVGDSAAHFLLVSPEDGPRVAAFVRRLGLEISPVLEETLAPEAFGELVLPTTVLLDREGRMVLRHRGAAEWDTPEVRAFLLALAGEGGAP